jgi:hypothetical protein
VVRVARNGDDLRIAAGGRLDRAGAAGGAEARIAAVLADPTNRRRWLAHAGRRAHV